MTGTARSSTLFSVFMGGLVLLSVAAGFAILVGVELCPKCGGQGLAVEPPGHGVTVWACGAAGLAPLHCDCCGDRGKVSLLRSWRRKDEPRPRPPVYVKGQDSEFLVARRQRIEALKEEALPGITYWPPTATTSRPDLIPLLAQVLHDDDTTIRQIAARTLAGMNHPSALIPLLGALQSTDPQVRDTACIGLSFLGRQPDLIDPVVSALKRACDRPTSDPLEARFRAAVALARLGKLHTAEPLVEHVNRYYGESEIVAKALADFDRKDAILGLIKAMATIPGDHVKFYGAALHRLTGESFGEDPVAWFRWFDKNRDRLPEQR